MADSKMVDQDQVTRAAQEFIKRRDRVSHPDGDFDKGGRWYPSDTERQGCCNAVRSPSRSWPYSYMVHCRTLAHVARLFEVDEAAVRKEVRRLDPPAAPKREGGERYFKAVAVLSDGRMVSIYDGETEYQIGVEMVEPARQKHQGGYYCYRTVEEAKHADVYAAENTMAAKKVVLRVMGQGQYCTYANGKLAFSRLTPIEIVS